MSHPSNRITLMKILVVDDEQDLCEILQYNLETEGYEVETANSAEEALQELEQRYDTPQSLPQLILLDIMMGEMSGFQLARKLKADVHTAHIPIVFITALDSEDNTVKGLNLGADDYIVKPLALREVKARITAVLRRTQQRMPMQMQADQSAQGSTPNGGCIRYESLQLDEQAKTATLDGHPLSLTRLEWELLLTFLKNPGKVFSREDLLERCWPSDTVVLDRTVDVNITRLRKKIGPYGKQLKTRFGYGYTFQ